MSETTLRLRPLAYALQATAVGMLGVVAPSFAADQATANATFLVQMNNYDSDDGVYYTMYLVNPEGGYVKTLWVGAPKKPFWKDMPRWYKYISREKQNLAAVTGASVGSGDRTVLKFKIDKKYINAGYKIRIDDNLEDGTYTSPSVLVDLDKKDEIKKIPGKGYVRYLRFKWD